MRDFVLLAKAITLREPHVLFFEDEMSSALDLSVICRYERLLAPACEMGVRVAKAYLQYASLSKDRELQQITLNRSGSSDRNLTVTADLRCNDCELVV